MSGPRLRPWMATAALIVLVAAVYGVTRHNGFTVFDDPDYLTDNPMVLRGLTRDGLWWAFLSGVTGNWHPLTWLSHMADVSLFGRAAGAHHLVSAGFHAANAVLLYRLLDGLTDDPWPSFAVACLFAVHPLHVESVAWAAERKDVLSTFFGLLSLLAYAWNCRRPRWSAHAASLGLYAASLMAKSMLVTLPLLLLVLDIWPLGRRGRLREKAPYFLLAALSAGITVLVQGANGNVSTLQAHPLLPRLANAALSAFLYLRMAVWPAGLAVFHPFPALPGLYWKGAAALLVLAAVTAAVWRQRARRPYLLAGWAWYLVTLLPVIGLVQVGIQGLADRYTYIPLIGPFIMVAWGGRELAGARPRTAAAVFFAAVAGLGFLARAQAATWRSSVTLFSQAARTGNDCALVRNNLGMGRYLEGDYLGAAADFRLALRMSPSDHLAHAGLGKALWGAGRREEAIAAYREAVRFQPGDGNNVYRLARALAETGHGEEALARFGDFLALGPGAGNAAMLRDARMICGLLLRQQGRPGEARRFFQAAVNANVADRGARLGLALAEGAFLVSDDRPQEAREAYHRALAVDPANAEAGRALATLPLDERAPRPHHR